MITTIPADYWAALYCIQPQNVPWTHERYSNQDVSASAVNCCAKLNRSTGYVPATLTETPACLQSKESEKAFPNSLSRSKPYLDLCSFQRPLPKLISHLFQGYIFRIWHGSHISMSGYLQIQSLPSTPTSENSPLTCHNLHCIAAHDWTQSAAPQNNGP